MEENIMKRIIIPVLLMILSLGLNGQTVPEGIHYQAVARDNYGNELANRDISVKFSILSGNPDGPVVYQEVHSDIRTSAYGVFSLKIGEGSYSSGSASGFSEIQWETAPHWVRVEVQFPGSSEYTNMGTMPFLSVPYALYAKKSLEPGPQGPKGDTGAKGEQGDPATDNQKLSFDGANLSISPNGNTVNLSVLNKPHSLTLLGDSLTILGGNGVSLKEYRQNLNFNPVNNILNISGGTSTDLTSIKQNLSITGNTLSITNIASPTPIDLSKYLQSLNYNTSTNKLSISNVIGEIDLSVLAQTLNYEKNTGNLTITTGNTVSLKNTIGFKARKTIPLTGLSVMTTYPFVNGEVEFNESASYESGTGLFTAPSSGIYTFFICYKADGPGSGRELRFLKNGSLYEILGSEISSLAELSKWITILLNQGETVSLSIYTGLSTYSGSGLFLGYRVN